MKNAVKNLLLLTLGLLAFSCNEKVAPDLEKGNASSGGSSSVAPTPTPPAEFFFQVQNASPVVLNYVLHRTGPGNATKDCKISSKGTPLTNTLYRTEAALPHDSKVYDISCFMEAEELALFFNGLDFKIGASKNTCDYIAYAPYSFHDAIPGNSSATYVGLTCDTSAGITNSPATQTLATTAGAVYGLTNTPLPCGTMVDTSTPAAYQVPRPIPASDQELCTFDYSVQGGGNGENCDLGKMSFTITNIYNAQTDSTLPVIEASERIAKTAHSCGGKISACIGGAIKSVTQIAGNSIGSEVLNTEINKDFSYTYSLPKLIGFRSDLWDIVNYRRGLANFHLDYGDYSTINEVNWGDPVNNRRFDPSLMEKYAANLSPSNTPIIDTLGNYPPGVIPTVSFANYEAKVYQNGYTAKPLAADPFMGLSKATQVNPFYTFYCLDRSMETKARIRMVVRDWDRVYTTQTADFELLTDVHKPALDRAMDLPIDQEELPGDPANFNKFDDFYDWDVLVPMTRANPGASTVYVYGVTTWAPSFGWWDELAFPSQGPRKAAGSN